MWTRPRSRSSGTSAQRPPPSPAKRPWSWTSASTPPDTGRAWTLLPAERSSSSRTLHATRPTPTSPRAPARWVFTHTLSVDMPMAARDERRAQPLRSRRGPIQSTTRWQSGAGVRGLRGDGGDNAAPYTNTAETGRADARGDAVAGRHRAGQGHPHPRQLGAPPTRPSTCWWNAVSTAPTASCATSLNPWSSRLNEARSSGVAWRAARIKETAAVSTRCGCGRAAVPAPGPIPTLAAPTAHRPWRSRGAAGAAPGTGEPGRLRDVRRVLEPRAAELAVGDARRRLDGGAVDLPAVARLTRVQAGERAARLYGISG